MEIKELKPFLNEWDQLTALPAKNKKKLMALYYLASKVEKGRDYTEKEINALLNKWSTFDDPATLRREMYNKYLLDRTDDGHCYRAEENIPTLEEFIEKYV